MQRVSLEHLQLHYDPVISSISPDVPIFIIGNAGGNLLSKTKRALDGSYNNLKILTDGFASTIKFLHEMPEDEKNSAIVVAAFDKKEQSVEALTKLARFGFVHCYEGNTFFETLKSMKVYKDLELYKSLNTDRGFNVNENAMYLILDDWLAGAGSPLNGYYLIQDLWGARKVFENQPSKHYDIGSRVDGFITHLLAFNMPTVLIDIRPLGETYGTENLSFIQADATNLDGIDDNSLESISALCSIEHFGLGRYGDPVDPEAHIKAFKSIQRVLKPGGNAYISVPVDKVCCVEFNAHRFYQPKYVVDCFDSLKLVEFSACTPKGLEKNAPLDLTFRSEAGLFHFTKKSKGLFGR